MLKGLFGLDYLHVPFRGSAPALQTMISGQIDFMLDGVPTLIASIRDGSVRAIAVTSATRDPALPDVPTFAEAGVPDLHIESWNGIVAPRGTPEAVVAQLNAMFNEALVDEVLRGRLNDLGARIEGGSPARFGAFPRSEAAKWRRVIEVNAIERLQ